MTKTTKKISRASGPHTQSKGQDLRAGNQTAPRPLRDEFACRVLPVSVREFYADGEAWDGYDDLAAHVYNIADAMMCARTPRRGDGRRTSNGGRTE